MIIEWKGKKTKNYIIKISGSDKDHKIAKEQIRELFLDLNHVLEADVEFLTQTIDSIPEWENGRLYGLGSKNKMLAI